MTQKETSILVVDDEYSVRDSLQSWFRKDGYRVRVAENADQALKAVEDDAFDVAVVDIACPAWTGSSSRSTCTWPTPAWRSS